MKRKSTSSADTLRRRAEAHNTPRRQEAPIGDADALRLLHELQVHQIELELQNDALKQSQEEALAALQRETAARKHLEHLERIVTARTAELVIAKEAAEASNLAKTAFLANMSHEIRTPLNAITGMTYLLRQSKVTLEQAARLDKIESAGQHLLAIINAVLDMSKIEAGKVILEITAVNPSKIIENVASMLADQAHAKNLDLVVEMQFSPLDLLGDATRLEQALLNYASNAIKFSNTGTIRMSAILVRESHEDVLVRFEVQDTGIGIAPGIAETLFTPFQQADNSITRKFGGTGLGLAITKRLAELMGGEVGFSSTQGVGSTFWFTSRLEKARTSRKLPSKQSVDFGELINEGHFGKHILVVDDQPMLLEVTTKLLEQVGLRVSTAANGEEAIRMARETEFALIMMDVQMPKIDGLEATRQIRRMPGGEKLPIIGVSGSAFIEDERRSLAAGMSAYVAKPYNINSMFALLMHWLERH